MGKLFIIEGSDSSGKETQSINVTKKLIEKGYNVMRIEFPNYNSKSSELVKMYLNGDFGSDPQDVDPYTASSFYGVDRYASFKTSWEKFYTNNGIIISDRYTVSNMIHQGCKINNEIERKKFFDWLLDFEYNKLQIPKPDLVIFLDMPPKISQKLLNQRSSILQKDIHESDKKFLLNSYDMACKLSKDYNWEKIACTNNEILRHIDEISDEIISKILIKLKN